MRSPNSARFRAILIGSGLLGTRRAIDFLALEQTQCDRVVDPSRERGLELAARLEQTQGSSCLWLEDSGQLVMDEPPDLALVAVPHDAAAAIVQELLKAGVNTLMEKPMGLTLAEAQALAELAEGSPARLALGFNYRHYPAIARAKRLLQEGAIGRPLFARLLLGHGGRPGYEQEWKLSQQRCGGGALMDPGIHLIDLARFFLGELEAIQGHCARLFWPVDVEDSVTAVLKSDQGGEVYIQSSIVEWQNHFAVHLFGESGYLKVDGRMGNYGPQRLVHGTRWAWLEHESQAAGDRIESFGDVDTSYLTELRLVVDALRAGLPLPTDHHDGLAAMQLVDELYRLAGPVAVGPAQPENVRL